MSRAQALFSRRTFVRWLIAGFGIVALMLFDIPYRVRRKLQGRSGDWLAACFPEMYGARDAEAIGRAYLKLAPDEASRDVLLVRLLGAASPEPNSQDVEARSALVAGIAQKARQDYGKGELVLVDGWQISRTEARLCALSVCGYSHHTLKYPIRP